ncbi:unnamed protein product [Urochloa humidicola]
MEATGRDGDRGPWSYREQTRISSSYTISSTTSGTVSTGYTSNGSHLSWISMEAARHFQEMEEEDAVEFVQPLKKTRKETEKKHTELAKLKEMAKKAAEETKMKQIKNLAKEFFRAPSSAKCSIEGADMSALDKWFAKLGVGWVLHVADGAVAGKKKKLEPALDASSWIRALAEIGDAFRALLLSGHGPAKEEEGLATEQSEEQDILTEQVQLASFIQQAILKMLAFVDAIAAPDHTRCEAYQKPHALLRVHDALSEALLKIWSPFDSSPFTEVGRIQSEIVSILSAKEAKADEATWSTMDEIRNGILESVEDGDDSSTPQGLSDIHKATRSLINFLVFLQDKKNRSSVAPIVSEPASFGTYAQIRVQPPLTIPVVKMVFCLEEKLANKSEEFLDQSLRFLFLLNNTSFLLDQLQDTPYFPENYRASLSGNVEGYMESYVQQSWAPLLSCLSKPTPRRFRKHYSILPKFESEFQKTYSTQKLWKVPDPKLRNRLRKAIIERVIPPYTKYIEDNNVTTPRFTPQKLVEMLQELFEGRTTASHGASLRRFI